jgi:hypothetical protein
MSVHRRETHKVSAWVSGNKLFYSFMQVSVVTIYIYIKWRYLYSFYITTCFGHCLAIIR